MIQNSQNAIEQLHLKGESKNNILMFYFYMYKLPAKGRKQAPKESSEKVGTFHFINIKHVYKRKEGSQINNSKLPT